MTPHPICHTMALLKYSYLIRPKNAFHYTAQSCYFPIFVWSIRRKINYKAQKYAAYEIASQMFSTNEIFISWTHKRRNSCQLSICKFSQTKMCVNHDQMLNQCYISFMSQDSQQLIKVMPHDMGLGKPHYQNGGSAYRDWQLRANLAMLSALLLNLYLLMVYQIDTLIQNNSYVK